MNLDNLHRFQWGSLDIHVAISQKTMDQFMSNLVGEFHHVLRKYGHENVKREHLMTSHFGTLFRQSPTKRNRPYT